MKNGLKITILLLITTELVLSSSLDISKCGCMCRNDQDHTLSSQFLAPQKSVNHYVMLKCSILTYIILYAVLLLV